jgi:hypothetical protein
MVIHLGGQYRKFHGHCTNLLTLPDVMCYTDPIETDETSENRGIMRPMTLGEIEKDIFGFGKRLREFTDNAERWRKISTAYANAGQFREADDAQSEAIDLERAIEQLHEDQVGIPNI